MSSPESLPRRSASRAIAREAVRSELSIAAYELVVERGFDNVTLDDLAAAGGVSRSTFLRYFRTKDQAVVVALEAHAERMADTLRARPADESDWTALRIAIESFVIPIYSKDPLGALAVTRLILAAPTRSGQDLGRQDWRTPLTRALAERAGVSEPVPFGLSLKVAAALQCLNMAIAHWAAADGAVDLVDLIDEGFAVLGGADTRAAR